jgi:death-on-curing protein
MRYPSVSDIIAMHAEIMTLYNQTSQLRDKGEAAIESALMRPQMVAYYENADLAKQAAFLIAGIAQAHPFVDGNKRIALAAGDVMIQLNGYLVPSQRQEFGREFLKVLTNKDTSGDALEAFANWIRSHLQPLNDKD